MDKANKFKLLYKVRADVLDASDAVEAAYVQVDRAKKELQIDYDADRIMKLVYKLREEAANINDQIEALRAET
jgi:hypothetical protein